MEQDRLLPPQHPGQEQMANVMRQVRAQFPMYSDVPDEDLLNGLHKTYYADMDPDVFRAEVLTRFPANPYIEPPRFEGGAPQQTGEVPMLPETKFVAEKGNLQKLTELLPANRLNPRGLIRGVAEMGHEVVKDTYRAIPAMGEYIGSALEQDPQTSEGMRARSADEAARGIAAMGAFGVGTGGPGTAIGKEVADVLVKKPALEALEKAAPGLADRLARSGAKLTTHGIAQAAGEGASGMGLYTLLSEAQKTEDPRELISNVALSALAGGALGAGLGSLAKPFEMLAKRREAAKGAASLARAAEEREAKAGAQRALARRFELNWFETRFPNIPLDGLTAEDAARAVLREALHLTDEDLDRRSVHELAKKIAYAAGKEPPAGMAPSLQELAEELGPKNVARIGTEGPIAGTAAAPEPRQLDLGLTPTPTEVVPPRAIVPEAVPGATPEPGIAQGSVAQAVAKASPEPVQTVSPVEMAPGLAPEPAAVEGRPAGFVEPEAPVRVTGGGPDAIPAPEAPPAPLAFTAPDVSAPAGFERFTPSARVLVEALPEVKAAEVAAELPLGPAPVPGMTVADVPGPAFPAGTRAATAAEIAAKKAEVAARKAARQMDPSPALESLTTAPPPPGPGRWHQVDLFADTEIAAAKARLNKRARERGAMHSFIGGYIDPRDVRDVTIIGANYMLKGVIAFDNWAEAMVREFGEVIRPHLQRIYNDARAAFEARRPTGNDDVRRVAERYTREIGIGPGSTGEYRPLELGRARRVAQLYEKMPDAPRTAEAERAAKQSYDALVAEIEEQFKYIEDAGFKVVFTKEDPYADSAALRADIAKGIFKVFSSDEGHHPYMTPEQTNKFRAVHDFFGHAKDGFEFGPRGEENAFLSHAAMFSDDAIPALATETRGQNSWVNFFGDHEKLPPRERPFAKQKFGLLPEEAYADVLEARRAPGPGLASGVSRKLPTQSLEETAKNLSRGITPVTKPESQMARALADGEITIPETLKTDPQARTWYSDDIRAMEQTAAEMMPALAEPGNMALFKVLLGISSQRNTPLVNFAYALTMMDKYLANGRIPLFGRVGQNLGIFGRENVPKVNALLKQFTKDGKTDLVAMERWLKEKNEKGIPNAVEALGPKVGRFFLNVAGEPSEVTVDMWMVRWWNRVTGRPLRDGKINDAPSEPERRAISSAVQQLADRFGITPAEVQALLWSREKKLWLEAGIDSGDMTFAAAARHVQKRLPTIAAEGKRHFNDALQKDLFELGKSFEDVQLKRGIEAARQPEGGYTFNPESFETLQSDKGYSLTLASVNQPLDAITPDNIRDFRDQFTKLIKKYPNLNVGVFNLGDGRASIDLNLIVDDPNLAKEVGRQRKQIAVYDYATGTLLPTGYRGKPMDAPASMRGREQWFRDQQDQVAEVLKDLGRPRKAAREPLRAAATLAPEAPAAPARPEIHPALPDRKVADRVFGSSGVERIKDLREFGQRRHAAASVWLDPWGTPYLGHMRHQMTAERAAPKLKIRNPKGYVGRDGTELQAMLNHGYVRIQMNDNVIGVDVAGQLNVAQREALGKLLRNRDGERRMFIGRILSEIGEQTDLINDLSPIEFYRALDKLFGE